MNDVRACGCPAHRFSFRNSRSVREGDGAFPQHQHRNTNTLTFSSGSGYVSAERVANKCSHCELNDGRK